MRHRYLEIASTPSVKGSARAVWRRRPSGGARTRRRLVDPYYFSASLIRFGEPSCGESCLAARSMLRAFVSYSLLKEAWHSSRCRPAGRRRTSWRVRRCPPAKARRHRRA